MALDKQILDWYREQPANSPMIKGSKEMVGLYDWKKTDNVLDIGCGAGYDCKAVAGKVSGVTGIDIQPEMIAEATKKNGAKNIQYAVDDFMSWVVADERFDVVMANWSFCHFRDKKGLFSKVYRILERGGTFLFTDRTIHFEIEGTLNFYNTANELYRLIADHGFSNIKYFGEENVIIDGEFSNIYRAIFKANK